jgi:hypothetical protein
MTTFDEFRNHCLKTERGGIVTVKETDIVAILKQDKNIVSHEYSLLIAFLDGNIDRIFCRTISLV